ncbi:hypothetical protein [Hazenella coriacea]|uniref:Foldase protein PrsA n=1 Tax=Hazenella coriacea TaxID=1179467 RepID=A0A4R3L5Q5_9BACL|nr:hypothetical protein [Hazenella coriacea]TCS94315.1 hypothetical protein EDD58_104186 [Hazenella coriacea]
MKKWLVIPMVIALGTMTACGQTPTETKQEVSQEKLDLSSQKKLTQAYQKLDDEWQKDQPDLGVVRSVYDQELRAQVQGAQPEIDQLVDTYINAGQGGQAKAPEVKQIVMKSLQHYFYEEMKSNIKEKVTENFGNKDEALLALAQGKVFYDDVLRGTAEKRDSQLKTTIATEIDTAFADAEKAIQSQKKLDYLLQKQIIDKSMFRVFYLSTDAYATKVSETVKTDPAKAKVQQLEGFAFYQAIQESLSKGDAKAAEQIGHMFSPDQNPQGVNAKIIKQSFVVTFSGKVEGYITKVLGESWENRDQATEQAFEANMFLKAIELDLEKALGHEEKEKLFQSATQFFEATQKGDQTIAKQEAKVIQDKLVQTKAYFAK